MILTKAENKELDKIMRLLDIAVPFINGDGVQRCPACGSKLDFAKPLDWDNGIFCPHCEKRYSWIWWRQHSSEWKWRDNGTALVGYYGEDACPQIPAHCERICSYAFSNAVVTKVSIPDRVRTTEKYVFSYNSHVKQISLPEGMTRIEEGMFMGCDKLEEIHLPSTLTYIGRNAFSGCTSLKHIAIPPSVRTIDAHAFSGSGLKEVTVSNAALIGEYAFAQCKQLRTASLNGVLKIGKGAFSGSCHLKRPELSEGLLSIGEDAFEGCIELSDVEIPSSVYEIGNHAFANIPCVLINMYSSMYEYVEHFSHFCVEKDERKCYLVEPTARIIFYLEVDM